MYKVVQNCNNCGADLTLDDLRRTDCPYCKVVYPHHSQAQQHVQVIGQVMGQMMGHQAQIQNQWRGSYGVSPQPPPGGPMAPTPFGDYNGVIQAQMQHAQQMGRRITMIVTISIIGTFLLVGLIVAMTMLL